MALETSAKSERGGVGGTIRANGGDVGGGTENLVTFDRQSNCEYGDADIASFVMARDYKSPTDLVAVCITGDITHALKAEGADASEDGTWRGNPIVFGWQNSSSQGLSDSEHVSPTLDKSKTPAVAVSLRGREGGGTAELGDEIANALRASGGGGDKAHVLTQDIKAFTTSEMANGFAWERDYAPMLTAHQSGDNSNIQTWVRIDSTVRRLTPVECERLQGFPDNYTNIPYRGKSTSPDGPRYKALGNSWAVPKFTWIGERIARFMPVNDNDNKKAAA